MKRKFLCFILISSLIFCTACGTDESPVNFSQPQNTEPPEPTAETVSVELPPYSVKENFEVATIWRAMSFGDGGAAVMQMSEIIDGGFSFTVRGYHFIADGDSGSYKDILLISFSGQALRTDDGYSFTLDKNEFGATGISLVSECGGTLQLTGDSLMLCYENAEFLVISANADNELIIDDAGTKITYSGCDRPYELFLPTEFSLVLADEAGYVWYDMPLFPDEILLPIPRISTADDFSSLFGRSEISFDVLNKMLFSLETPYCNIYGVCAENGTNYYVSGLTSTESRTAPSIRGIKIGDSFYAAAGKFPGVENIPPSGEETQNSISLYGQESQGGIFGAVHYSNGCISDLTYALGGEAIRFAFDNSGNLESISWFEI